MAASLEHSGCLIGCFVVLTNPYSINHDYLKNSLIIHEENTKENNNHVVSLYVIKTRVTLS